MTYPGDEPIPQDAELDEEHEADVFAGNLVEDGPSDDVRARNHVADALAAAVGHCFDRLSKPQSEGDTANAENAVKVTLQEATSIAVGAVEGS